MCNQLDLIHGDYSWANRLLLRWKRLEVTFWSALKCPSTDGFQTNAFIFKKTSSGIHFLKRKWRKINENSFSNLIFLYIFFRKWGILVLAIRKKEKNVDHVSNHARSTYVFSLFFRPAHSRIPFPFQTIDWWAKLERDVGLKAWP